MRIAFNFSLARPFLPGVCALLLPWAAFAAATSPSAGDRNPGTHVVYPSDAFFHAGKGGRILDVTKPPFGAKGDGVADDTEALIKAYSFVAEKIRAFGIHNASASFIIYLPRGTYLVSDTILYPGPFVDYTPSHPGYEGMASTRFIGESRESTVIRLKDNCPGFERGSAKAVIRYAKTDFNNAETKSAFRNITIDTGRGNPGAVGLDFNGANGNSISNVTVHSGDGAGFIGIQFRVPPTQGYHHDITVTGFDYGISSDPYHAQQNSFEYVTLRNQRKAGFRDLQSGVSIRKLRSENTVPALSQEMPASHVILIDSELLGGTENEAAIRSPQGQLFVRNISVSGYGRAVEQDGKTAIAADRIIDEYISGPVFAHSTQKMKHSLNLPIKDVPLVAWPADPSQWANVNDYGARGDGKTDDSAAVQRAMNAGKPAICFPSKAYRLGQPISIPAGVQRVNGLFAHISGSGAIFTVDADAPQPVLIEDIDAGGGVLCDHAAPRVVILENIATSSLYRNRNTKRTTLFVDCGNGLGKNNPLVNQDVWCRFINTETKTMANFTVDRGATLWVFGYKVESTFESFLVRNGGKLEVLGGVANQTPFGNQGESTARGFPANSPRNIVRNLGGSISVILHTNGHQRQPIGYRTAVVDEDQGGREEVLLKHLPPRPGTAVPSRPGTYINEYFLPLYVHY